MHLRASPLAALLALATLLPAAPARADGRYDAVASRARPLDSLGAFLEKYVGSCPNDPLTRADCEKNARDRRRSLEGGVYRASAGEGTLEIVKVERRSGGGLRFLVTPFLDGGGLALTHGAPRKQDAAGHPLIALLVVDGELPDGMDELSLESALRTGRLDLQVVFRPEGTWKLPRRTEAGFYEGVKARFLAVRLVETRSGAELASVVLGA